jgi:phage internal scaffolding protein
MTSKIEIRKWGDRPKSRYLEKYPGKTEQSHKKACDINNIMARFVKTGVIEHENKHQPQYGDFYTATDFTQSMQIVAEANSIFAELPAEKRKEFNNDPAEYLAHIEEKGTIIDDNQEEKKEVATAPSGGEEKPPQNTAEAQPASTPQEQTI